MFVYMVYLYKYIMQYTSTFVKQHKHIHSQQKTHCTIDSTSVGAPCPKWLLLIICIYLFVIFVQVHLHFHTITTNSILNRPLMIILFSRVLPYSFATPKESGVKRQQQKYRIWRIIPRISTGSSYNSHLCIE